MSYFQKYLSRPVLFALPILILIVVITSVLLNNFLTSHKDKVEQHLSDVFQQRISIKSISFLPPNFIILKNLSFSKANIPEENQPILIENLKCMFSLTMLIFKRDFVISRMNLDKLTLDYMFVKENFEQLVEAIKSLTQEQPLKMRIRQSLLNIPQDIGPDKWITINATLAIDPNKSIFSSGSIGLEGLYVKDSLMQIDLVPKFTYLDYNVFVFLTKGGFIIDNLEFKNSQFYLKLWGILEDNVLTMNSYPTLINYSENGISSNKFYALINRLKKILLFQRKTDLPTGGITLYDLDISDVNCVIRIESTCFHIENLSFYVKGLPFRLKGTVSFLPVLTLNLKFSSFPNQPPEIRLNNPGGFDIRLTATLKKRKLNGKVSLDFLRKTKTKQSLEKIEMLFKDLTIIPTGDGKTKLYSQESTLSYMAGNNLYEIFLKDFNVLFYLENKIIKFVQLNSIIYDGFLEGKGFLDMTHMPFRSSFDVDINNVSANRLHGILSYCSKIYGNLSSQIHFRNYPSLNLNGELTIRDGLLDNIIFFKWVADFLNIPLLNQINFDSLSAEFTVDDKGANLERIHLDSKEVDFDGFFMLYENDLVSSKLSLSLSRGLLESSPKFVRLLNYMDKDLSSLSFNFQLSGLFHAMNFKWSESDFKQVLQDLLPYRLERKIERIIEKIIESISKK